MPDFKVNMLTQRRRLLLSPLWLLMRVWSRTLRIEIDPEDKARLSDVSRPTVVLFWHNRLFLAPLIYRMFRSPRVTYGLVSASKDGAWLSAFFDLVGLKSVRGSSSRGGREALAGLAAKLRAGHDVAITPDGPRGPVYSFKPGASVLIRRSEARVLLVGSHCGAAWRLNSWDRFLLPLPFSRVRLQTRMISPEDLPSDFRECTEGLRESLDQLNRS